MEKSIKEIADDLGISKQKVYRWIQANHITASHQDGQTKRYDDAAQDLIKRHFSESKPHHEAHRNYINEAAFDALLKQLEDKDKQIAHLMTLLDHEQQLRMVAEQKLLAAAEDPEPEPQDIEKPRRWWQFWR